MNKSDKKEIIKALVLVFFSAALIIGSLDFFHTCAGVQAYLIETSFSAIYNWPVYIPLQMGFVGLSVAISWLLFRNYILDRILNREVITGPGNKTLIPLCIFMAIFGYYLEYLTVDSACHTECFLLIFIASIIYLTLFHSKHQIMAFITIGIIGIFAEWILLDPKIGYYEFVQKDWFDRSSTWLLPTYGWVGIFAHQITRKILLLKENE